MLDTLPHRAILWSNGREQTYMDTHGGESGVDMPRVTVREDGTAFIRARIHPGTSEVRVWELKREGIHWLRKQGIGVEQEMGRRVFDRLRNLGYAYIANPSGRRSPSTRRRKLAPVHVEPNGVSVYFDQGPNGRRKVITVPPSFAAPSTKKPRRPRKKRARK